MKVYLAARYSRHPEMRQIAADLRRLGHEVTARWIHGHHEYDPAEAERAEAAGILSPVEIATDDITDLLAADAVISFTEHPNAHGRNRGGRHVEFGIALATGKRLMIVGPCENVFHHLPAVEWYPTWRDAYLVLRAQRDLGAGAGREGEGQASYDR